MKEEYTGHSGVKYIFEYTPMDSIDGLEFDLIKQSYAVCFCDDKIVIVHNSKKDQWELIGGTVDPGEHPDETLCREIVEEANMKVLEHRLLGVQKVTDTRDGSHFYQLRYVCKAEPIGVFESDPDGTVDKIALIDPKDYKEYFYWGKIGEAIIDSAVEFYKSKQKTG